jgi:hypothetical protein
MKIVFPMVSLLLFVGPLAGADFTYQEYTKAVGTLEARLRIWNIPAYVCRGAA